MPKYNYQDPKPRLTKGKVVSSYPLIYCCPRVSLSVPGGSHGPVLGQSITVYFKKLILSIFQNMQEILFPEYLTLWKTDRNGSVTKGYVRITSFEEKRMFCKVESQNSRMTMIFPSMLGLSKVYVKSKYFLVIQ